MDKITFCINTAKNEKDYIQLLLESLLTCIDFKLHNILIFIDSDNQDTTSLLIEQKSLFPNLKLIKNHGAPIGYQKNINYMFKIAETEIVSYLQSDNVVSYKYDEAVLQELLFHNVISATRIEPPLHAQYDNAVTLVKNFGLHPSEFQFDEFLEYAEQRKQNRLSNHFFAPFTLYKENWLEHDCSFVKSREDSDISLRFVLNGNALHQSWNAIVYHFSCQSSRGPNWWLPENKHREIERMKGDQIELERFVKKWGGFVHASKRADILPLLEKDPSIVEKIYVKNEPIDERNFEII